MEAIASRERFVTFGLQNIAEKSKQASSARVSPCAPFCPTLTPRVLAPVFRHVVEVFRHRRRRQVSSASCLGACYAMSGTEIAHAAVVVRARCAMLALR
eukprot:700338-Rhodomonas_salina.2